jgi:hypothetical protein
MACKCGGGGDRLSNQCDERCGCGSLSGCGANCNPRCNCGCNSNQGCSSAQPFYLQSPGCQESHDQVIVQQSFKAELCTSSAFSIPTSGSVVVTLPSLAGIVIGSFLWNPTYGYLQVTAFDYITSSVTLTPLKYGVSSVMVPACTCFIVTDNPAISGGSGPSTLYPYVAVDFTAPACGTPLLITVTNTNGLVVGGTIKINGGTYTVVDINTPVANNVTILNESPACLGLTPGSPVIAQDSNNNYITPIYIVATNPCDNTAVASGKLVVCKDHITQTLSSSLVGQIPVTIDTSGTVQLKNLDVQTLSCTTLDVCMEILVGVTTYTISVADNSIFSLNEIIQIEAAGMEAWRFQVTNINVDGHHITITISNGVIPAGHNLLAVGTPVCVSSCCEQLAVSVTELFTPCNTTFQNAVDAVRVAAVQLNANSLVDVGTLFYGVGGQPSVLYTDGGTIDMWTYIDLINTSTCRNAQVSIIATLWAELLLVGVTVPFLYYSLRPNYGYEILPIASAFTNPWLHANGDHYTEVEPIIRKSPAVLNASGPGEPLIVGEFPLSTVLQEHSIPAGNKIRVAIRTNVSVAEAGNQADAEAVINQLCNRIIGTLQTV